MLSEENVAVTKYMFVMLIELESFSTRLLDSFSWGVHIYPCTPRATVNQILINAPR